ncbi:PREDICTED: anaphase-promoting complex subunit 5 isoform X2 [Vollenhovia emeryi]|uniref:anaphase-promoting complex subunit 5 isoform X2 n=1 Tax=Vollenhovia emeryi TaxID=411798 RepID=UPI0005F38C1F|nr:PREDICTED: anaphase-promoting complex subunit 5 isoform X2 [Vollenhovia emeryi]
MSMNDGRLYTVNDIFNRMSKEFVTVDGNVRKIQRESLTPYKVATVILIKEYCNDTTREIAERRNFCLASLKLIQSADMELDALLNMMYEYSLDRFADQLEINLDAIHEKGIDELLDLFDNLRRLMESKDHPLALPALSRNSVLGLYVRRMLIFFEKLAFDQVVALYNDMDKVRPSRRGLGRQLPSAPSRRKWLPGSSFNADAPRSKAKIIWGGRQAELLVAQQAHALQTDEHKALPPVELQVLVQDLLKSNPYNADAHYLSYLNCIRVNDFCGAVDSLYHCFDRLAPLENRSTPEDRSRTFRYAALNLAVLHAQFNHKEVAQYALKEAIKLAQEVGDNVCLQLAHSWMSYLISKENKGPLIERSVGKASLLGITHTTGLSLISHAHSYALEAKNPPQVFDILMKSDMLNCQHSMSDLMSVTFAEKSALWAYYGKMEMASLCAQLLLFHNTGDKKQHIFNGPSTCQAIVTVANMLIEFGEYALADVVLAHAKERFPNSPCNKIWMLSEQLHTFAQLLRQEKWSEAEAVARGISSVDQLESRLKLAEVCLAKGDFPKGLEHIGAVEEYPDVAPPYVIRAALLSCQILCASASPDNGTATNCIMRLCSALELAAQNHLAYYKALVKMHLANVQLLMGLPVLALSLVEDAIPTVLGHGGCYDQGKAFMLYGKCLIASAPESPFDARKEVILSGIKTLSKAQALFAKVNAIAKVKSIVHLRAVFYNEIDLLPERNQCAFEFRQMDEQYLTCPTDPFLY